ncbi:MAG: DUF488 domain-containing protein [Thaumarchaeota archaeon]|nr:MAG: DUF488 domain-containing protein [Nitrososphaerota archaeon]TLY12424.1 MAG: DUF488 domain-containing protein [Nitrososphaerota archaeon]
MEGVRERLHEEPQWEGGAAEVDCGGSEKRTVTLLCVEKDESRCHRSLLRLAIKSHM